MRTAVFSVLPLWLAAPTLAAQSITGSITGSVTDPAGLPVQGVEAVLTQPATGMERRARTGSSGDFVFSSLPPGEYSLHIAAQGFKRFEKRGLMLSASETLPAGQIALEIGAVTETVSVTAQGATVQTASAERAGVVTSSQVDNLLVRGRNVMALLQLLPGVVDSDEKENLDRNWNLNVNGNRRNTSSVSLDGLSLNAIGNNNNAVVNVSQDAVAEVKVLLSNYQAEYGRMSGANIQIVTKSGAREFHGLGSYFKRHEQFNANDFFNNRLEVPKPRYRYNTWNYNIGGPVFVPKRFNRNRDKLFFFWSQEYWPIRSAGGIGQRTTPTERERAGDFSQSVDLNGRLIPVADPLSRQPFAGNIVPASRVDPNGQALLKFLPLPNFFDTAISARRYNYLFQNETRTPQRAETLKLDYNINANNLLAGNFTKYTDISDGQLDANWQQMRRYNADIGKAVILRYQRIFSPTLINELNLGFSTRPGNDTVVEEEMRRNQRQAVGFRVPQFYPASNPLGLIPNATFGGVTNAVNLNIEGRYPLRSTHQTMTLTNNLSKTWNTHTVKAGLYVDRIWRNAANPVNFNGTFSFNRDVNNPLDTGYAFSNAALGVFSSYTEATSRPWLHYRLGNVEWFAQDNWRVSRRLTLDYGLRMYWMPPIYERENRVSGFVPDRFNPARQVRLIQPAMVSGRRVGQHPLTGETYPATLIGAIAPGAGDPANGMVVPAADGGYPRSLVEDRGIHFAPRIGFAIDPFANGKTAIRGGFGVFYNRQNLDAVLNPYSTQTPLVDTPVINYSTLSGLLSSTGVLFPQNVLGIDRLGKVPTVFNYSLSVQRNVGFGTVVDVGYVGSVGRRLMWVRNLNAIPFGANFAPRNADPTNPRTPLQPQFLRPYTGYNNVNFREFASSSNYHSMQVTVNRRFARGVQFGTSWTWSKAMDFNDTDTQAVSTLVPVRVWNYGLASFDRTHVLKVNWLWDLPKARVTMPLAKAALDDWQVSGIASFVSGEPLGINFGTVQAMDITGSPTDGARIVVTGNPVLPKSERTFSRNFRTEVFRLPERGTYGNAAKTLIRGPGVNRWDIAVFKNFPVREQMKFQFRWELYNAFNHTQFSGLDVLARFDNAGQQVNARFGEFTASRSPRQMQFALRFYF